MRKTEKEQVFVVEHADPAQFQNAINAAMDELKEASPRLDTFVFESVYKAIIHYQIIEEHADTMAEKAHVAGVYFSCDECPYFEEPADGRSRYGFCPISQYGKVKKDDDACEWYYKRMANGGCEKKEVKRR